jgi:hypothetical protein
MLATLVRALPEGPDFGKCGQTVGRNGIGSLTIRSDTHAKAWPEDCKPESLRRPPNKQEKELSSVKCAGRVQGVYVGSTLRGIPARAKPKFTQPA